MDKGVNVSYLDRKLHSLGARMGWALCDPDFLGMARVVGLPMVGPGTHISTKQRWLNK